MNQVGICSHIKKIKEFNECWILRDIAAKILTEMSTKKIHLSQTLRIEIAQVIIVASKTAVKRRMCCVSNNNK
jgi:hypothetical protein